MLVTRFWSGLVLLIIAIGSMFLGGYPLLGVLWLISCIGFYELTKATKCNEGEKVFNTLQVIGFVGSTFYYGMLLLSVHTGENLWIMIGIAISFLAILFTYVVTFPKFNADAIVKTVFSFIYAPVMLSFVYLTREYEKGHLLVWLILISSWGCDTCAYCVGKLIGKKKIFPVLSPKKSLEGCFGGVLGAAIIGAIYGYFFVENAWAVAIICAFGAVMSMVGDLAASAIKRNYEIKDYGKLIPGHGGIMDRFDSMIITAPMVFILALVLFG